MADNTQKIISLSKAIDVYNIKDNVHYLNGLCHQFRFWEEERKNALAAYHVCLTEDVVNNKIEEEYESDGQG